MRRMDDSQRSVSETLSSPGNQAWPSFRAGFRATLGLAVAGGVFGILFGVIALAKGLAPGTTVLMSAALFAGSAQVAVLELWREPLPYAGLTLAVLLVCSRHVLLGVTLHDTLTQGRGRPPFLRLFFLTDANFVLTSRERLAPDRLAFFLGSGMAMYSFWVVGTLLGVLAPALLDERTLAGLAVGGALYIAILIAIYFQGRRAATLAAPALSAAVTLLAGRHVDAALAILAGVAAAAAYTLIRELARRA